MNSDHQSQDGKRCLRHTFRELVGGGEGLHVCIVMKGYRTIDPWGGPHDIHIDKHQIMCTRRKGPDLTLNYLTPNPPDMTGLCSYDGLIDHAKDAIPYFLKKWGILSNIDKAVSAYSALCQMSGGPDGVDPGQLRKLITQEIPELPSVAISDFTDWLAKYVRNWVAGVPRC